VEIGIGIEAETKTNIWNRYPLLIIWGENEDLVPDRFFFLKEEEALAGAKEVVDQIREGLPSPKKKNIWRND
jgi:hypothetical protein